MQVLMRIAACFIMFTTTAKACDLDDCALPKALHQIDGKATPANGIWTWLHHDLALTREAGWMLDNRVKRSLNAWRHGSEMAVESPSESSRQTN